MINPPSTFGQPEAAPVAMEPAAEPGRSPRTVVIAAVAGVVALGVLGGAAALVLTGDDPALDAAPAPAVVEPVPEPSATAEVTAPLPVSAVRSRNIFVPLVEEASDAEAGAEGGDEGSEAEAEDDPEDTTEEETGTGGGPTQVVVDEAALQALRASEQQVAELQRQITDLTARLEAEGDDSELEAELAELREQYELLLKQAQDLKDALEALEVTVAVEEVDTSDPEAYTATLLVDGVESVVDLDPDSDVGDTAVLGKREDGEDILIRYVSYTPEDLPTPAMVSLEVGSTLYTVAVGGELYFYLG